MSTVDNKTIVRAFFEEIGQGNIEAAADYVAPDYTLRVPGLPEPVRGIEDFKEAFNRFTSAFEMTPTFEDLFGEGDKVAARVAFRVKHIGEFEGIPATGKEFTVTENDIFHLREGKITEHIEEYDNLNVMQQLGAIPAAEHGESSGM
jgi:predicted ester cyclase